MLILTRKKGESIIIDGNIEVTVIESSDGKIKLGIEAPKNIEIHRKEVHESIQNENKQANSSNVIDMNSLKDLLNK